jgi:hypothetical protein
VMPVRWQANVSAGTTPTRSQRSGSSPAGAPSRSAAPRELVGSRTASSSPWRDGSKLTVDRAGSLGDCIWHVYAMIGKLTRKVYLLTSPVDAGGGLP